MIKADQERIYNDVKFLTELRPYRNYLNIGSLEKVCDYLINEFSKTGLEVEEQKWIAEGNVYKNIIASYNCSKPRKLIIGAHYDVDGNQPGADDNASAVAGLLETARMVSANEPDIDYGIEFVAYSLEESPFFRTREMGSYIHAKSLFENKTEVIGMICYEMIGYFSDKPRSQHFPYPELAEIYPDKGNFIMIVGIDDHEAFNNRFHELMAEKSSIDVQAINLPADNEYVDRSDHRNYWKFGYKALMINDTSFMRNPNYHKLSDTIDTLNFGKMTEVINSSYNAIVKFG